VAPRARRAGGAPQEGRGSGAGAGGCAVMRGRGEAGFSLIEVAVAVGILAVALTGLLGAMTLAMRGSAYSGEVLVAQDAARAKAEEMGGREHRLIFCLYNGTTADDPGGSGTAPGDAFAVPGLTPVSPATTAGKVIFPTNAAGTRLREDPSTAMPELGMPKDLNGDLDTSDSFFYEDIDPGDDYERLKNVLLPAKIVITWTGATGPQKYELCVQFADRTPK